MIFIGSYDDKLILWFTSGAYIYTIVNVVVMHMRAPNRRPVVKPSG